MQLSIEPNNGIPIYEQLIRQIKFAVAGGVIVPGQIIPSVREMARQLAINPNTVQRAYLQLQDEEVLQALRGRGMAVCSGAKRRCSSDRQQIVAERFAAVIQEGLRSGFDAHQLREMFEATLSNTRLAGEN